MKKKSIKISLDNCIWAIFAIVAVFCFFTFQQGDIVHTGGSSLAYLNGHITDFYEYNKQFVEVNNYLPSTYIIFAIWNIPIKLLGWVIIPTLSIGRKVLFWYKLLPTVFYIISGYLFYKILCSLGSDRQNSKLGTFVFLSTPIAFFSQFIFGQYDIFTVCFVLLGFYYWLKKDWLRFALFFGIAITFKYFSLLIFFPLLLLQEKNYLKIIRTTFVACLPFLLEVAFYLPSQAFREGVFGFGATGYITDGIIQFTFFPVSIVIVLWIGLCGMSFFKESDNNYEMYKWGIYVSSLVCFLTFGLSQWHPQWLLFMIPFLVLGALLHEKMETFLILDLLLMGAFTLITITLWSNHVDQNLMFSGVFKELIEGKGGFAITMGELLHAPKLLVSCSLFTGFLLVATFFKHPRHLLNNICESIQQHKGLIWTRFIVGVSIFVIPALLCFFITVSGPDAVLLSPPMAAPLEPLIEDQDVRQYFTGVEGEISEISIAAGTYAQENGGTLIIDLFDASTDKRLATTTKELNEFRDNKYTRIAIPTTNLQSKEQYYLKFTVQRDSETDMFTLYRTMDQTASTTNYAVVDGNTADYGLCINLYGKKL